MDTIQQKMDAAKKRKLTYSRMRADGELEKDEYKELCGDLKKEMTQLEAQMQEVSQDEPQEASPRDMQRIRKALERMVDTSGPKISEELLDEFVEVVTPMTETLYRWKLNFGERKAKNERTDMVAIQEAPLLTFQIDYEMPKNSGPNVGCQYRNFGAAHGMTSKWRCICKNENTKVP